MVGLRTDNATQPEAGGAGGGADVSGLSPGNEILGQGDQQGKKKTQ